MNLPGLGSPGIVTYQRRSHLVAYIASQCVIQKHTYITAKNEAQELNLTSVQSKESQCASSQLLPIPILTTSGTSN